MNRSLSLTTDSIPELLWRVGLPSAIGMLFNTLFHFVDTYSAGLLSTDALAALSLSYPIFFVLFAVGSGLAQGTTALLANTLGAGRHSEARKIYAQSILFATIVSIALSISGWLLAPWAFVRLGAQGTYVTLSLSFTHVMLSGALFFILTMTLNTALAAQGNTRIYRNYLIAGCLANCVLNPPLMWGWFGLRPLGVAGIAAATVMIQFVGCIFLWRQAAKTELARGLTLRSFEPDISVLRSILAQALPAILNMLTIAVGVFVITAYVQQFGRDAVAASGIATRIEQAVYMPAIGLSSALLSIAGQNHGAGKSHRVREAWRTNLRYGVALMMAGGALMWFAREWAISLFTSDRAVIAKGAEYLSIAAIGLAAYPILFGTVFLLQALKHPSFGLYLGLYRQFFAPLVVIYMLVFSFGWGLSGIWWGVCVVNWSAALFTIWWGWRIVKEPRCVAPEPLTAKSLATAEGMA